MHSSTQEHTVPSELNLKMLEIKNNVEKYVHVHNNTEFSEYQLERNYMASRLTETLNIYHLLLTVKYPRLPSFEYK